ncbi:MAG TPA: hypothetical protein VMT64_13445, partial [Candidatus Binataceae bacterium]|nr:hypothetical protein [Candidatus Binataceae bacterium]
MLEGELHEHGLRNLSALAEKTLRIVRTGNIFAAILDGNFEASLLLLDSLWTHELASTISGEAVVAIPARDILAFCSSASRDGVEQLRRIAAQVTDGGGDHLLSPFL